MPSPRRVPMPAGGPQPPRDRRWPRVPLALRRRPGHEWRSVKSWRALRPTTQQPRETKKPPLDGVPFHPPLPPTADWHSICQACSPPFRPSSPSLRRPKPLMVEETALIFASQNLERRRGRSPKLARLPCSSHGRKATPQRRFGIHCPHRAQAAALSTKASTTCRFFGPLYTTFPSMSALSIRRTLTARHSGALG